MQVKYKIGPFKRLLMIILFRNYRKKLSLFLFGAKLFLRLYLSEVIDFLFITTLVMTQGNKQH